MADAVSECRTAADQAAELDETGEVGFSGLAKIWSAIHVRKAWGGLILEGTEAKSLSMWWHSFMPNLCGCMFNDPVGNGHFMRAALHNVLVLGVRLNKEPRLRAYR